MAQFKCHACDVPITSLTSQKNGNLDTCVTCAIDLAPFVRYTLKRRSEVLDDLILCHSHYQEDHAVLLQPLTQKEIAAGMTQTVTPYSGVYGCRTCAEVHERGQQTGDDHASLMAREG